MENNAPRRVRGWIIFHGFAYNSVTFQRDVSFRSVSPATEVRVAEVMYGREKSTCNVETPLLPARVSRSYLFSSLRDETRLAIREKSLGILCCFVVSRRMP